MSSNFFVRRLHKQFKNGSRIGHLT